MKNSTFIKQHGESVATDWIRVSLLDHIANETNSWKTPSPICMDTRTRRIAYERLHRYRPLLSANKRDLISFLRIIGEKLFIFHSTPIPDNWMNAKQSFKEFPLQTLGISNGKTILLEDCLPTGMLHGDCWHGNILFTDNENFALIDPLPNEGVVGAGYFIANGVIDLAMLYMSLFVCHPLLRQLRPIPKFMMQAGFNLIDGYLNKARAKSLRITVMQVGRILAERYIDSYSCRLPFGISLVKRFAGRRILSNLDQRLDWK